MAHEVIIHPAKEAELRHAEAVLARHSQTFH